MNPAAAIVKKCGGAQAVADLVGVHVSNVHRWTYPRERGGTGGHVPARHQQAILDAARRLGIDLTPADFFDLPPEPEEDAA